MNQEIQNRWIIKRFHLQVVEVEQEIKTLQTDLNILILETYHRMLAMIEGTDLQLLTILELLIEIQLFNLISQVPWEDKLLNMLIQDLPKRLDLLKDLKFMDQMFQDNLILKKSQLVETLDSDHNQFLTLFKKPFNKNLLDSQISQSTKVFWDSKILWFQIKLCKR